MVHIFPKGPKSDEHKKIEEEHIIIRRSTIPGAGNGVFCTRDILKGESLGHYTGEIISDKEFENRYNDHGYGEYVLYLTDPATNKQIYVDAKDHSNWVSRINASKGTGKKINVYWDAHGHVFASRNIKAGEELLANYGNAYWKGKKRGVTMKKKKKT